jgi:hypothetical protein
VTELLAGANLARLAYIGLDSRPRVVPIWFAHISDEVRMITGPKAEKAVALAANPAVALTIDSSTPPYKVLLVQGDARLEHVDGMAPEYPDIVRRYLGPATDAYLGQLRVKRQVRIIVSPSSCRVFDFVRRYPNSLR